MGPIPRGRLLRPDLTMDVLFSCRNCIHNCGQTPNLGPGMGFCLQHNSLIRDPGTTTCKYLHRKDLPHFAVEEGVREHAAEFTFFPGLVSLTEKRPLPVVRYSEAVAWERREFSPVRHVLAQYFKTTPRWILIQSFTGGTDGVRAVAHASLVRRYLDHCGKWTSSYRLVLALVQEIDVEPHFSNEDVLVPAGEDAVAARADALWDVVFTRLSCLQEYGWHAGIESLTWITDSLNGALTDFDWPTLQEALVGVRNDWTERLIRHAKENMAGPPEDESSLSEEEP